MTTGALVGKTGDGPMALRSLQPTRKTISKVAKNVPTGCLMGNLLIGQKQGYLREPVEARVVSNFVSCRFFAHLLPVDTKKELATMSIGSRKRIVFGVTLWLQTL